VLLPEIISRLRSEERKDRLFNFTKIDVLPSVNNKSIKKKFWDILFILESLNKRIVTLKR
jgi:hypothetical protein